MKAPLNACLFFHSSWLWTLSFSSATRSWPSAQRSTSTQLSTSTLTSSTSSFTSWPSWVAPGTECALFPWKKGSAVHFTRNDASPHLSSFSFLTFPLCPHVQVGQLQKSTNRNVFKTASVILEIACLHPNSMTEISPDLFCTWLTIQG